MSFVVDGFNVYYSLLDAIRESKQQVSLKWLDLHSLCQSYITDVFGKNATMAGVFYFSAPKTHRLPNDPDIVSRHMNYTEALDLSGVGIEMARFKKKDMLCPHCKKKFEQYEEKETDIAIAAKIFELLIANACDVIVIVSGDTDLIPAVRMAKKLFPDKEIWIGFPHRRFNVDLDHVADGSFRIKPKKYRRYQFPNPLVARGRTFHKPSSW